MRSQEDVIQALSDTAIENGIVALFYVPGDTSCRIVNPYPNSLSVEARVSSGPMPLSGRVCDPRIDFTVGREAAALRD